MKERAAEGGEDFARLTAARGRIDRDVPALLALLGHAAVPDLAGQRIPRQSPADVEVIGERFGVAVKVDDFDGAEIVAGERMLDECDLRPSGRRACR